MVRRNIGYTMKINSQLLLFICLTNLNGQVDYTSQIQTIFSSSCTDCHGNSGGLNLTSYSNVMAGGDSDAVIVANDHANSLLWQKVSNFDMPPSYSGFSTLSATQINLMATWIDEGALEYPAISQ